MDIVPDFKTLSNAVCKEQDVKRIWKICKKLRDGSPGTSVKAEVSISASDMITVCHHASIFAMIP